MSGVSKLGLRRVYVAIALALLSATVAGCQSEDSDSVAREQLEQDRLEQQRREADRSARQDEQLKQLRRDLRAQRRERPSQSKPAPATPPSTAAPADSPARAGGESWPEGQSGWTAVLASASSFAEADRVARRASAAGLAQAGVTNSDNHSSLNRGYWVAYSGVLGRAAAADRARQAQALGFSGAYARYVSAR